MVESIYVQAFKRRWTKIKLRVSYRPFRCSLWSAAWPPPCLSIVLSMEKEWWASWWRWSLYSTWLFPLSSFKSSPMFSVLLSVEELELLIIPYCHVFENHLHFLYLWLICPSTSSYYHRAMVPILRHIVITDFHRPCRCLIFHSFFLYLQNRTCTETPLKLNFMKLSFQRVIVRMKWVPSGDAICLISPCTGLQNLWFLMRWKGDLKELPNMNFSFIVHLWTRAQILMETATSLSSLVDD
jgi:hypothetical protein